MKMLDIHYMALALTYHITDDAAAIAAHAAIKKAMEEWKEFGNTRDEVLTVTFDGYETAIRVGAIASVGLQDGADAEAAIIARDVWSTGIKRRLAERLAKETPAT